MIDLIFNFLGDTIIVKIDGKRVMFGSTSYGSQLATIDGLQLSYEGVIKEFPELKDSPDWKKQSIAKFKDKINNMNTENEISDYIIEDLKQYGYEPRLKQRAGFRPERIR